LARIEEIAGEAALFQADISSWAAVRAMAEAVFEHFGRLDVLVNNDGDVATEQMSWRDIDQEIIDRVIDVDIKGTMYMHHEFGTRMLDQGSGSIINIGSTVVVRGSPRAPQYAAGKYGVLGLTKSYANAFAPTVRVNAFAPGFMETDSTLAREDWNTGRQAKLISATPAGRIPPPEELASTALFLATEDAAHMYGSYLIADGGYNMIGA
jgi:3-oxoacyl-[acyl-carrier protein] reductase